jgi:hypothetical protein
VNKIFEKLIHTEQVARDFIGSGYREESVSICHVIDLFHSGIKQIGGYQFTYHRSKYENNRDYIGYDF